MTDNDKEVVRTLKNHIEAEDCVTCESFGKCDEFLLTKNTLDLINRQQAEIERLKKYNTEVAYKHYNDGIKEFAERLKDKSLTKWDYHDAVDIEEIDNLVKEMVGDTE